MQNNKLIDLLQERRNKRSLSEEDLENKEPKKLLESITKQIKSEDKQQISNPVYRLCYFYSLDNLYDNFDLERKTNYQDVLVEIEARACYFINNFNPIQRDLDKLFDSVADFRL